MRTARFAALFAGFFGITMSLAAAGVISDQLPVPLTSTGQSELLTQSQAVTGGILYTTVLRQPGVAGQPIAIGQSFVPAGGTGDFTAILGTSDSANALTVGPNGVTNPVFNVDASTASAATGLNVKGAAAAGGVAVSVLSSGTNEALAIDAKGSGTITINGTATGNVLTPRAVLSSGAAGGVGYTTGAGCAVTQASSRTTGVTCTGVTGAITLVSAAGSATPATFAVTDTSVAATDTIIINQKSGTDLWEIFVTAVGAGSFNVTAFTTGGTTTEQPVFNFAVLKGAAS